ncbi:MAG: hypothetical protein B6A08_13665 [Sorangiineae bacterium NIC37A_2]|nr:MAG: hypothetical protein B6A08_13665 [Sorangiineae bacterium NIC37A_2]
MLSSSPQLCASDPECYDQTVERTEIDSQAIRSVGYDPATETLEIEFRTGRVYVYEGVPASVHQWFMKIPSKGGFVNRVLEPKYGGREVTEPSEPAIDLEAALRASLEDDERPSREN